MAKLFIRIAGALGITALALFFVSVIPFFADPIVGAGFAASRLASRSTGNSRAIGCPTRALLRSRREAGRKTGQIRGILVREILVGRTKRRSHAEFQLGARDPSRQFPRRDWLTFSAAA